MSRPVWAMALLALAALHPGGANAYDLTITGGVVHGPGPMPDTPLPQGHLGWIVLGDQLSGGTEFFNNGAEPPEIPGEVEIYGHNGGKLSSGAPFNKHVYGGVVSVGQGALKMLSVVAGDGDLKGKETYKLDERLNWEIHTDLALDAGFPQGLVISRNIKIFTGVLTVAPSLQKEGGLKGGLNLAGSLPSGAPVYGMLGDIDERGFLDGRIVGVGRVPLGFMFVPGSPLVMEREFRSNIPVTHDQAGVITYAGLSNLQNILSVAAAGSAAPADARAYVLAHAQHYVDDFAARAHSAHSHLVAAGPARAALAEQAAFIETVLHGQSANASSWASAGAVPDASMTAIAAALQPVDAAIPALRAAISFPQLAE